MPAVGPTSQRRVVTCIESIFRAEINDDFRACDIFLFRRCCDHDFILQSTARSLIHASLALAIPDQRLDAPVELQP